MLMFVYKKNLVDLLFCLVAFNLIPKQRKAVLDLWEKFSSDVLFYLAQLSNTWSIFIIVVVRE